MKKALTLALTLCLILSLFAGMSGTAFADGKKTMTIGDTTFNAENWEETIDPHRTYNGWPCIRYGVGETLVHYTDNMELEPWLATKWTNDGNNTWTITLRDGSGRTTVTTPGPSPCGMASSSPPAATWTPRLSSSASSTCWRTMTAPPVTPRSQVWRPTVRC